MDYASMVLGCLMNGLKVEVDSETYQIVKKADGEAILAKYVKSTSRGEIWYIEDMRLSEFVTKFNSESNIKIISE